VLHTPGESTDRELWERISSIFADALELPAREREPFLLAHSAGSEYVENEVRRLLVQYEQAGDFLETQALTDTSGGEHSAAGHACRPGDLLSGRFHIVRLLGAGGMGEVYEALDTELRQKVAIKTLRSSYARDPEMVGRFRSEVLRSRQITHSNVARVYDMFTHRKEEGGEIPFFTMELLEGEPLSRWLESHGPLAPEAALPLLEQMAAALHAAHSVGIVHRDFKPGNVFISSGAGPAPKATVTDFGIAAQLGEAGEHNRFELPVSPGASLLAGTPAYMAPERLLGGAGTSAVDIYALGLVAYEMLTGQRAYDSRSPLACALKKAENSDPELFPADSKVPAPWIEAIHRAVRRNPEQRFADPLEFVAAVARRPAGGSRAMPAPMPWLAAALLIVLPAAAFFVARSVRQTPPRAASLAVLPFENTGGDAQANYLSDGIAEGLIRSFTAFPRLRVAPQAAAAVYRDRKKTPQQIARSLDVEMLLLGSFHQSGNHLQLTAELRDRAKGNQVWTENYDCDMEQLLTAQQDIASQVAARLSLGPAQPRNTRPPTSSAEAYDLFLRGRYLWNTRTREGVMKAIDYFGRAATLDPSFALAYTGTADAYIVLADYGWMAPMGAAPRIRDAFRHSLALDADSAETQASLGLFNNLIEWDQPAAERAFQRALSLEPSSAMAHTWYAAYLERAGRLDEALREAEEARRLDPATLPTLLMVGWIRYYRREYDKAIEVGNQVIELFPAVAHGHQMLALTFADSGRREKALAESAEAIRITSDPAVALRERTLVLSRIPGYEAEARKAAAKLEAISTDRQAGYLVRIYAALRDSERMYLWAGRALQMRDAGLELCNIDSALDPFRSQPRFRQVLRQMGY